MPKRYIPKYYYTGESSADSDEQYWYIYLKSTGHISFDWPKKIDVFLVGGGGAGGNGAAAGGGGGGYTTTGKNISIVDHVEYSVLIGRGGVGGDVTPMYSNGADGESTQAFGLTAMGGEGGKIIANMTPSPGGSGGSGGGAGTYVKPEDGGFAGAGGSNGSAGGRSNGASGGAGQGSSTHAFADARYPLYAGGGGGYTRKGSVAKGGEGGGGDGQGEEPLRGGDVEAVAGTPNTGGGGGAGDSLFHGGAPGGSGVVIIRGTEQDYLPVYFEDTRLQEIWYNGTRCDSLIFNGQKLY